MTYAQEAFSDLLSRINHLRDLMITAGQQQGLYSPETLKYSEQLDELSLQFQLLNR